MGDPGDIHEWCGAQRVDLHCTNNGDTSGIYCCTIETNAVNDDDGRETVYVGLYVGECAHGEEFEYVNRLSTNCTAGDVTIPRDVTFTVDSDLSGESPQFTLTCTSTGGPSTTVTWTRGSETVSGGMTVLDDPVTAQYTHTLTVTGRLGGQYQCTVANSKPSQDSVQLTVQGMYTLRIFSCPLSYLSTWYI